MFIHFHKIRYQNFLSTGNEFTEIQLDRSASTLILGDNGSGKSTMIDAITYALYGKPYRNINKPQLVNSITGKGLLVELEFNIGSKKYLIRRGMKYNVFEVFCNGVMLNQNAAAKEYQDHLERNIIKMSHKSFCQVVVLGTANFTPFMQLAAYHRREVIEDMLDLQVFAKMLNLLKEQIGQTKTDITDNAYELKLIAEKIRMYKENLSSIQQNNQDLAKARMVQLEEILGELKELEAERISVNSKIEDLDVSEYDALAAKRKKFQQGIDDLIRKQQVHQEHIDFFHDNDTCPTCTQTIDEDFKADYVTNRVNKIKTLADGIEEAQAILFKMDTKLESLDLIRSEISGLERQAHSLDIKIHALNRSRKSYQDEIRELETKSNKTSDADSAGLIALLDEQKKLQVKREELLKLKQTQDHASMMLKDGGIKTKIIKQYIPIINKLVNKYLSAMDFFVNFELNEKFEEVIKSRHRDEFSYNSFSEGEKARLDLALLLTWRALAKLRNSASTNLLILDEVFDGSLDVSGSDDLLNILTSDIAGPQPFDNIFVISHKSDNLYDKFHSAIRFTKTKNFSKMS